MAAERLKTPPEAESDGQYDRVLAEYRFQVDLNWRRSEYLFVLNIGIFVAAVGLLASSRASRALVAIVFLLAASMAALSVMVNRTQHSYYRAIRDQKNEIEAELGLGDRAIRTTPGMGGRAHRLGRVKTFLLCMLSALAVADMVGAGASISEAVGRTAPRTLLSIELPAPAERDIHVVLTHRGSPAVVRAVPAGQVRALFRIQAGRYGLRVLGVPHCTGRVDVAATSLQVFAAPCGS